MKKIVCSILAILFILPLFIACENNTSDESSLSEGLSSDCDFTVKFGKEVFEINKMNGAPIGDEIVVYSRDYRVDGKYSINVKGSSNDRTIVSVRAKMTDDGYEFDVVERTEEEGKGVIPYNGFALSIPSAKLEGVRLNVGQIIDVEGYEALCPDYERTDLATISPDYLLSTATRRVSLADPVNEIVEDKIYYITEKFGGAEIPVDNIVVTVRHSTNYSCEILSVGKKDKIDPANKGEAMFVFTGEYNIAFAEYYFGSAERITISNMDKCNSYSDNAAFVINGKVVEINKKIRNLSEVVKKGIYFYDSEYITSVTPAVSEKRFDVVVVDNYIVYIGEEGGRSFIPEGNGFVITFVGDEAVSLAKDLEIGQTIETCFVDYFVIPDKYVEIGNNYFGYDFQNGVRAPEGVSVVYTSAYGKTTGSNIYGSEIVVSDGKVVGVNIGKGDSVIPENGFVLSIHKDSPYYKTIKKIKVGDSATLGLGGNVYGIDKLEVTAINSSRNENALVFYSGKASTQTNPYGYEIAIDDKGFAISDGYDGNMAIPKGGFVLSGHGINKTALEEAYSYGQKVIWNPNKKTVLLIKTPEQRIKAAEHDFSLVSDRLAAAKKTFLNLDYKYISAQFTLMDSVIDEAEKAFKDFDFDTALEKADSVISTCEKVQYSFYESNGVENRAAWYRSTEKSDEEVLATVLKMKELNINALYLETWYEGYCIGSKVDVDGVAKHPYNGNYDALEGFIRIGHEHGIEVHAWVHNFFVGFYYKGGTKHYNPAFDSYKDKHLVDIKGRDYFYYTANDNYFIFLNANDRECRDLILDIYKQLITKYDLDGLHLDYVRMPELNYGSDDFGYNEDIINAFAKETGITKDPRTFVKNSTEHKKWVDFRCNIITGFVGEVYDMVRANKPDLWLSAATYPDLNMAKNDIFQDVRSLINNGYLDEVFSMSYGVEMNSVMPSVKSYNSITENKVFYSAGIAGFLETNDVNFGIQLDEVIKNGADGVSVFALSSVTPNSYYKPIAEGAFRDPSVQINKLSITASAQMKYLKSKVDNLADIYETIDVDDIAYIKSQCDEIISFSDELDVNNATVAQKLSWCNKAMSKLASVKTNIISRCGENKETDSVISEIELLEYWLKISALRLADRK